MKTKRTLIIALILFTYNLNMNAQKWETPIIEGYGKIAHYEKAQNKPDSSKVYKIIFHIKDGKEREGVNEGLWKIARLINLMGSYNVPKENLNIVAVISGKATPFALTEIEHKTRENKSNPNLDLLSKLKAHNVKLLVCGQALAKHNINPEDDLNAYIELTISALIAIPSYQMDGYVPMF